MGGAQAECPKVRRKNAACKLNPSCPHPRALNFLSLDDSPNFKPRVNMPLAEVSYPLGARACRHPMGSLPQLRGFELLFWGVKFRAIQGFRPLRERWDVLLGIGSTESTAERVGVGCSETGQVAGHSMCKDSYNERCLCDPSMSACAPAYVYGEAGIISHGGQPGPLLYPRCRRLAERCCNNCIGSRASGEFTQSGRGLQKAVPCETCAHWSATPQMHRAWTSCESRVQGLSVAC